MIRLLIFLLLITSSSSAQTSKPLSRPEKDFETFWNTFNDNYAFFPLKGVNWDSTYRIYRPKVTRKTKEKELTAILQHMVAPLNDGHITLSKGDDIIYKASKPSYFKQEFKGLEQAFWQTAYLTLTNNNFSAVKGTGPAFRDEQLYYTATNNHIGYIRITRCFGTVESLFDDTKEEEDIQLMTQLFDELLVSMAGTNALIIDLRANGGGHGGLELASRFVTERRLTHFKAIRQKGGYNSFTEPEPIFIIPNAGTQYLKPIVLLVNDKTASSAEDFTISLYQQDNVTTIGSSTSGMLSDMFSGELSNNISFTLSNQAYYTTHKELLEDKGVPVAIPVWHTKQDISKKTDPVINKALERLKSLDL
jgi:carboxyl-terminal processing protease